MVSRFGCFWNHDAHSAALSGAGTSIRSLGLLESKTWTGLMKLSPIRRASGSEKDIRLGVSGGLNFHSSSLMVNDNAGSNSLVTYRSGRTVPSGIVAPWSDSDVA